MTRISETNSSQSTFGKLFHLTLSKLSNRSTAGLFQNYNFQTANFAENNNLSDNPAGETQRFWVDKQPDGKALGAEILAERNTTDFKLGKPRIALDGTVFGGGYFPKYTPTDVKINPQMDNPDYAPAPAGKEVGEDPFKRDMFYYEKDYKIVTQRTNGRKFEIQTKTGFENGYNRLFQVESSLKTEGIQETPESKYEVQTRGTKKIETKIESNIIEIAKGPELNSAGTVRAATMSSAVGAIDEWNKWITVKIEMDKATARIEARQRAFFRDNYPIPPEPKDLPRIKLRIERDLGKPKAAQLMKTIEEFSYAFYEKYFLKFLPSIIFRKIL